ncbi:MAG TPA: hypothetical protein VFE58_10890 [Tepidisphaeraceae bacterium]|nr:hypothetical protein [Tepidisphaeraceae bacterium]
MTNTEMAKVQEVESVFKSAFPQAEVEIHPHGWAIRARITDPGFKGLSRIQREEKVFPLFKKLKTDLVTELTMLLLRAPGEEKGILDLEFEDPSPVHL